MNDRPSNPGARADSPLPIEDALPALGDALRRHGAAVLQAPPGAGKTTRAPLALLDAPWLGGGKILMLEPRRLAARAAARHMARLLGETVGETVGYRVRLDTRVGSRSRIEVVTEGILTRMIQEDPALEDVALLIFDEFHERSLHADLGLALALHSRALVRDDLRVLVMSATLDGAPIARLLGNAPIVTSEGRLYPVETRYAGPLVREQAAGRAQIENLVVATVRRALGEAEGDVLVFLPGASEIRRVEHALTSQIADSGVIVAPLYGNLSSDAQDRALLPAPGGRRKVVLATSIAETSLTIEGVRVVVDSGLARVPRFSPRTGMTRLETVRVSQASADQRRGRAGRVAAGLCFRLWNEQEQFHLLARARPEILEADLASLALELALAGIVDATVLPWLDPPPAASLTQARELLRELEALDGADRITTHGRRLAALGVHPRLAHMIVRAHELGQGALACDLAALLEERDPLRGDASTTDPDLRLRVELLIPRGRIRRAEAALPPHADRDALRRVRESAAQLKRQLHIAAESGDPEDAGVLLGFAYPDRIAQRREGQRARFLLRNGRGAELAAPSALAAAEYVVAAQLDDRGAESRIFLAAPVTLQQLLEHFGARIEVERVVAWDDQRGAVTARRRARLGAIVLEEVTMKATVEETVRAIVDGVARRGAGALPWSDAARRLQQRLSFLHALDPQRWPDVSDDALSRTMADWLPGRLGTRPGDELARVDLAEVLLSMLDWRQRAVLDELAPTHVVVPSGSRLPIDYSNAEAPVLAVRLQEMFGAAATPSIGGGRVPLTLHLLSPAHRPVQVTRDLANFWRSSYFDVRKDLRGRYPKHYWPDDPLQAEPTSRAKRRS